MDSRSPSHPSSDEGKLTDALTLRMKELIEAHSCPICHEILNAPVRLPCAHVFCSLCIRRHLSRSSNCPHPTCPAKCTTSNILSLRHYDATLTKLRKLHRTPIPVPIRNQFPALPLPGNLSRGTLVKKLSSVGLATIGTSEVLQNRYREFVLRFNAASDSAFGAPKQKVLDAVRRYEAALSEPQKVLHVFSERSNNELVAQQGDSFDELVRKTKRRKRFETPAAPPHESTPRHRKEPLMSVEESENGINGEENKGVEPDRCTPQRTSGSLKRPRSATAQSECAQEMANGTTQNLSSSSAACAKVTVKSLRVNVEPVKCSSGQTPPSARKLTQVTPPSGSDLNLTQEQMERIRRNKMAAMQRRRQNSQNYVRRLPFTGTQEAPTG